MAAPWLFLLLLPVLSLSLQPLPLTPPRPPSAPRPRRRSTSTRTTTNERCQLYAAFHNSTRWPALPSAAAPYVQPPPDNPAQPHRPPSSAASRLYHLRFLHGALGATTEADFAAAASTVVFDRPLRQLVAPRHAYVALVGAPHGRALLADDAAGLRAVLATKDRDFVVRAVLGLDVGTNAASERRGGGEGRQRAAAEGGRGASGTSAEGGVAGSPPAGRLASEATISPSAPDDEALVTHHLRAFSAFKRAFSRGGMAAAKQGDAPTLLALLSHGWCADLHRDRRGASALHWACGHGHTECVEALLATGGVDRDDKADGGATPLHWASCGVKGNSFGVGGHVETARLLLEWEGGEGGGGGKGRAIIDT